MVIEPGNSINSHSANAGKARQQATKAENSAKQQDDASPSISTGDSVSISSESRAIADIEAKIAQSSDVDAAKVAQVKAELASGRYSIDSGSIADKLINEESQLG